MSDETVVPSPTPAAAANATTDPAAPPAIIIPDPPVPGPTPADYDAAVAQVTLLDGHVHELEVKLNERDAEILSLRAKLDAAPAARPVTGEVVCTTCGTRLPRS